MTIIYQYTIKRGCGGMADAADSKSADLKIVWVQVPPAPPDQRKDSQMAVFFVIPKTKS